MIAYGLSFMLNAVGGFLDVFDAFEVETVYVSGDPKGTLSYNSFLVGVREEGSEVEMVRTGYRMDWGGVRTDVIAPPPGELFSETNDNSVAILLSNGTARVLARFSEACSPRRNLENSLAI